MFFSGKEKIKRRPIFTMMVAAMSVYGAYSMVKCIKETVCDGVSMVKSKMKSMKKCDSSACGCDDSGSDD